MPTKDPAACAALPAERCLINGEPAAAEDLRVIATTNYGHFTSMQVVDGRVRGLALHLQRLERGTRELFDCDLDGERVRRDIRRALADESGAASIRVTVFARGLNRERPLSPSQPDLLVIRSAAAPARDAPIRVRSVVYGRELPRVKHVGTFALFYHRRLAQQAGYDDALFVDHDGRIAEGTTWNIGFFDDTGVVWPQAPMLAGVSMQLLDAALRRSGVRCETRTVLRDELAGLRGAFATNSGIGCRPIVAIDRHSFDADVQRLEVVRDAYESCAWERI
jgi:branched-subunit amino acid aminotransferase/4-amino-4-deoxychorismate lyase